MLKRTLSLQDVPLFLFLYFQHANPDAVYQPKLKQKSDADIMRDAKLEAMGLRPEDHEPPKHKQSRMATDDVVSNNSTCVTNCRLQDILGYGTFQEAHEEVRARLQRIAMPIDLGRYLSSVQYPRHPCHHRQSNRSTTHVFNTVVCLSIGVR